ncbi:MAG: hypothetical protein H6600_08510 [Flavobacteriales bacterium]|nr:hypothetical protein [Flavobacteriales bacterium]MCB9198487.1 hypothetical protein [Flavobacteriales bacterium]
MKWILYIFVNLMIASAAIGQTVIPATTGSTAENQPQPLENSYLSFINKRQYYLDKDTKTFSSDEQKELDILVSNAAAIDKNSFQYNYMEYINRGRTADAFEFLQKADEAYPNNAELFDDFLYHYEMTGNTGKIFYYSKKLYESNTIPEAVMEYNYNVLMSVDKGAILFTNGSDDTYPILIWQSLKKVRTDVKIINFDMLNDAAYIERLKNEYQLKVKQQSTPLKTIEYIIENNGNKNLYVGHTLSRSILKKFQNDLYLSGLTYKYSTTPIDNIKNAVQRYESDFKTDQLRKNQENSKVNALNFNYTLPLITILEYYKNSGSQKEYTETRELILKIAKKADREAYIIEYLTSKNL